MHYLALLFALLVSCTHMPMQELPPGKQFKQKMKVRLKTAEGQRLEFNRPTVIPRSAFYDARLYAPGDIDKLQLISCSRNVPDRDLRSRARVKIKLAGPELEKVYCPLLVVSLEAKKQRHAFMTLILKVDHPAYTLKADVFCDGEWKMGSEANEVCDANKGLISRIRFDVPVRTQSTCKELIPKDSVFAKETKLAKNIEYRMPLGTCNHFFYTEDKKQLFMLTTLGWEIDPFGGI